MRDIIVDDEVIAAYGESVLARGKLLTSYFNGYINILKQITSEAIISGDTHDAIQNLIAMVSTCAGFFQDLTALMKTDLGLFDSAIKDADEDLY